MLLNTHHPDTIPRREPWNKGKLVGPQPLFKLLEIWIIRTHLLPLGAAAARLCESTPLVWAICKADMRIVASITEVDSVRHILEYIGERVDPR